MLEVETRLARIEGQLTADDYLIRHLMNRLLAVNVMDASHTIGQIQRLAEAGDEEAAALDDVVFATAFRDRMKQIVADFEAMKKFADGPTFQVIPGGRTEDDP